MFIFNSSALFRNAYFCKLFKKMNALVLGASGLIGGELVKILIQ